MTRYSSGELTVPIFRVLRFGELPEGLEDLAHGRIMGKAVLSVERKR